MLQKLKSLIFKSKTKEVSYYLASNVLKSLIPFMVLPFITHRMEPSEFGIWSVFSAVLNLLIPFTVMGLNMIVGRNFHISSRERHSETTFTAISIISFVCFLLLVVAVALSAMNIDLFGIPASMLPFLPLLCFLQNIQTVNRIILRHENRALLFAILEVTSTAFARFGGLVAIVLISTSWTSLLSAQVIANVIFAINAFWLMLKDERIRVCFDKEHAKEILKMGWPLMPHAVGGTILTLCDRVILERMTDTASVGIYSLGASLGVAVLVFCTAFNNSWGPWMHRQLLNVTDEKKIKIVRYTYGYFAATILLSIATSVAAIIYVLWLVDASYHDAMDVIWWTAGGSAFYGMTLAINHYLIILGKTGTLPLITGASALVNIALSILLIDAFGMIGAAQATFLSYLMLFALMFWQCQKVYPMPWLAALHRHPKDHPHAG